jgi:hypothetical protein
MRPACLFCARKHLGQAAVLLGEAANGYPDHVWLAIGHLAEASDELIASYPDAARAIRAARKPLETSPAGMPAHVDIMGLIARVTALESIGIGTATVGHPEHRGIESGPVFAGPQSAPAPASILQVGESLEQFTARTQVSLAIGDAATKPSERVPLPKTIAEAHAQAAAAHASRGGLGGPVYKPSADGKMLVPDNGGLPIPMPLPSNAATPAGGAQAPCLECADKAALKAIAEQLERERIAGKTFRGRLAILTTLGNFEASYSLTGVVLEQAHAAAMAGYRVILFVHRKADLKLLPVLPPEITIAPVVPHMNLREDVVDDRLATELTLAMMEWFGSLTHGVESLDIISHDLLFQSWFVTFAKAIHNLQGIADGSGIMPLPPTVLQMLGRLRWWHMTHSSVGTRPAITAIPGAPGHGGVEPRYWRHSLPRGHQLITLNFADVRFFADYYHDDQDMALRLPGTSGSPIHVLRNSRDLRPFLRMNEQASYLTTHHQLHLVDVFMIYPLSIERAREKGLREVLLLLGAMQRHLGTTVRLLLAAAHANGKEAAKSIAWIKEQTVAAGLTYMGMPRPATPDELAAYQRSNPNLASSAVTVPAQVPASEANVIFSNEALPDTAVHGLPADDVRALWQVANLFVFPTISEAGPLVLMEAALAGVTLVLNGSLPALADYVPRQLAMWIPWGSSKEPGQQITQEELAAYASLVWDRMQKDTAAVLKRRMYRQHSLEAYGQDLVKILNPEPEEVPMQEETGALVDPPAGWNEPHPSVKGTALDSMRRHPGPAFQPEDVIHPADVGRTSLSKDQPPEDRNEPKPYQEQP